MEISIIIKALNEEKNIERAIKSSLNALKGFSGEVILADSLSTDKTIQIAKKYKVKIVQLMNACDRSCGIGPQLGFQESSGKYVYILDGDMEIEKEFLKKAIAILEKESKLAGIAGTVKEMRTVNMVFQRRKEANDKPIGNVDRLEMGGLYKRAALLDVGYFSNRNLHAYEEAELGFRLMSKKWSLQRIDVPAVKHYGYDTTSFGAFKRRWKTKYARGGGEFLKSAIGKPYFFKVCWHLKLYLWVIKWWVVLIASLALVGVIPWLLKWFLIASVAFLVLFFLKKRNIKKFAFSLVSWHYSAAGIVWGLFSPHKDPAMRIPCKVIKK